MLFPPSENEMPKKTQAEMTLRLAKIRETIAKLERLQLTDGPRARKKAENLAGMIQEQSGLIRAKIRDLLN
jgi:hypothetical protein